MNDPLISRFADACGATGPLDLRVDVADGGVLAEGSVPMPFTLVGRDDGCDVTLTDSDVNPRHAWLQVIGGRVFAIDLGSRTGLRWPGGVMGSGWMDPNTPMQVGPFRVRLRAPVSARPTYFPSGYTPLQSDPGLRSRPTITLEFRNGRRAKDRWSVNRFITLVGRAPECKIHLTAEDIATYHCGLVLTSDGLWVVDLSGRGVVVNGERMRVSPLRHGAELWVGRFLVGVQTVAATPPKGVGRVGRPTPPPTPAVVSHHPSPTPVARPATPLRPPSLPPPEDEVALGASPTPQPGEGLPSSHIMADAFRLWSGAGGPVSHPLLVSHSGQFPAPNAAPQNHHTPRSAPSRLDLLTTPPPPDPQTPAGALILLRQLGELHAQMFAQFQQSVTLLMQLFGSLRREQLPSVQRELARIQELNAELAQLQVEVAYRAAEVGPRSGPRLTTANPPESHAGRPASPNSTALHDWVLDQMDGLQKERQARWQSLVGMFAEKTG